MDYHEIAGILGISEKEDRRAAKILEKMLPEPDITALGQTLSGKDVAVFGAGPSLRRDIAEIKSLKLHKYLKIISADGATKALVEGGIIPDVIVTDLDGDVKSISFANRKGAILVVHAHADNIPLLEKHVPKMSGNVIGTTQCEPFGKVRNFGGFTDGDRAVFLAERLGAETVVLAGMDFGEKIGQYSGTVSSRETKLKKLAIGKELIECLAKESSSNIVNITKKGEYLTNVPRISVRDLSAMLGF